MSRMRAWLSTLAVAGAIAAGCNGPGDTTTDGGGTADARPPVDARVTPDGSMTEDGGDPCTGLTLCTTAGTSCDGDALVTCAANADGCMVETREDCGTTGYACDDTSGTAACVDPCSLIPEADRCATEGRSCYGDVLQICAMDANGCLVRTDTDCAAMDPVAACDDTGAMPVCAMPDPCAGVVQCGTTETRACSDADTITVCAPDATGCYVETTMDCTGGYVCDAASTTCVDPCAGLTVCPAATYCDATSGELVTCTANAAGCLLETDRTTCGTGTACMAGGSGASCVDTICPEAAERVLDCDSGTISANTATGGTTARSDYDCTTYSYPGAEHVWRFRTSRTARQAVRIVSTRGTSTRDYDLYVLDGGDGTATCTDAALTCLDSSTGTSATETVDFIGEIGQTEYVVYDVFNTPAGDTTDYTLTVTCTPIVCGDGVIGTGETCDDANATAGDGCSASCTIETGSVCYGTPSTCGPALTCGNGVRETGEACDDGDATGGDGCSATCTVEPLYTCTSATPNVCTYTCGNGTVNTSAGETCDDANTVPGDGCSATCTVESGYNCTGAPSVCVMMAPNATCAGAIAVTGTITVTGDTRTGGSPVVGTGCTGGATGTGGGRGVWYAVTIPAFTRVHAVVTPASGFDAVIEVLDSCAATSCSQRADDPEDLSITNSTSSAVTKYVFVNAYSATGGNTFSATFTYEVAACGNGVVDAGETCDDGGTAGGDGCSNACQIETGYSCYGAPSACFAQAANATCAGAVPLSGPVTGVDLRTGGPRPTGTGCGTSAGPVLYYSVTIPANTSVSVTGTPTGTSWDITLRSLADCSGACLSAVDSASSGSADTMRFVNASAAAVTQLLAVGADSTTNFGTFDLAVSSVALAPNSYCGAASTLDPGTTLTAQSEALGGPRPTGTGCGSSAGPVAYYAVSVPANSSVVVTATPTTAFDLTLRSLADCASGNCLAAVDANSSGTGAGSSERVNLLNATAAAITRYVAVGADSSTTFGTFDIAAAAPVALAANSSCATATPITMDTNVTGQNIVLGGPRPQGTGCGTSSGDSAYYYAVTVPAGQSVAVTTTSTLDVVLLSESSCAATSCDYRTDSSPESWAFSNLGTTPVTRIVVIHNFSSTGTGTFDAQFKFLPLAYAFAAIPGACVDASAGTVVTDVTGDDDVSATAALPFAFTYFGSAVTHYSLSTNGNVQLFTSSSGAGNTAYANRGIPYMPVPNGMIAPFWDDLQDTTTSDIRVLTTGAPGSQVFVVEWNNVLVRSVSGSTVRFQAHLYEGTNVVEIHYCAASGTQPELTGSSATVGIESVNGDNGVQVSLETAGATAVGTGYRFTPM